MARGDCVGFLFGLACNQRLEDIKAEPAGLASRTSPQ